MDINPFVVIGADQRTLVQNHLVAPHIQISYIESDFWDGTYSCTGTVIGLDTVLTNAHCVFDANMQRGAQSIRVYPAVENGFALRGQYIAENYFVTSHYINTGHASEDFAVIKVGPEINTGLEIGNVGTRPISTVSNIQGSLIGIHGYPGDLIRNTFSQWGAFGHVTEETNDLAYYSIDTNSGQSGSSMLRLNSIVGVHNASYRFSDGTIVNGGPKVTKRVVDFIRGAQAQ
ncbi:trypsin-like serine peptidase [Oceanobacillus sp. FSL H7-0719]|uniref:trypsin-like serine peptidase n=1 Tax=Oceanobacillus sp. FSL H7-0719 TaxID=2954507 RepID=UPI0032459FC1